MTLGNIFGLILTVVLFAVLVAITKFINKRDGAVIVGFDLYLYG